MQELVTTTPTTRLDVETDGETVHPFRCDVLLDVDAFSSSANDEAARQGTPPPTCDETEIKRRLRKAFGFTAPALGDELRPLDALRLHGVHLRLENNGSHASRPTGHCNPGTSTVRVYRKQTLLDAVGADDANVPPEERCAALNSSNAVERYMARFDEPDQNQERDHSQLNEAEI